jgi:glycosyltransferase involved in cell wall biosynthesis
MSHGNYVIITPVRNEEGFINDTIQSVISQTVRPRVWIIVNDGSTDRTREIIEQYLDDHPWIRVIDKEDRGFDAVSRAELVAFNEALRELEFKDWEYVVKLDGDVHMEKDYFEVLLSRFQEDSSMGIGGGISFAKLNESYREEKMPDFHPWSGARMYRRACFDEIGGLPDFLGGETIDILNAHMKGWETKSFRDLKVLHLRIMSSRSGLWEGKIRTGKIFYITGYHPVFLVARSIFRIRVRPYHIETFGVMYGYFKAMLRRESRVVTPEQVRFLRRQQLRRLFTGKLLINDREESS